MSIEYADLQILKVLHVRRCYRHAGPKGPEEVFSRERSRGTGPRATGPEGVLCGKKNSASKENSNVIYWFMSEYFMGYLLKCYWFFMLGSPIS